MPNAGTLDVISLRFTVHYPYLEYCARNSEQQAAVAFLAWMHNPR